MVILNIKDRALKEIQKSKKNKKKPRCPLKSSKSVVVSRDQKGLKSTTSLPEHSHPTQNVYARSWRRVRPANPLTSTQRRSFDPYLPAFLLAMTGCLLLSTAEPAERKLRPLVNCVVSCAHARSVVSDLGAQLLHLGGCSPQCSFRRFLVWASRKGCTSAGGIRTVSFVQLKSLE